MENPIYNTILARRSIRSFFNQPVEKDKVDLLLKAAMAAPSAMNLQPWEFIVIDDPDILLEVQGATKYGQYGAPLSILVCGIEKHLPKQFKDWKFDCGLAVENMLLESVELGLGAVVCGGLDINKMRKILDIPNDIIPLVLVEFGYTEIKRKPKTWYDPAAVSYQKYDKNKKRVLRTKKDLKNDD